MQLSKLATEPTLKKLTLDEDKLVEKYGEPLEFYIYVRLPLDEYMELAETMSAETLDFQKIITFSKNLMLDDNGKPVVQGKKVLPNDVALAAMNKVASELGNL